jgi:hypothetical protein
MRSRLLLALLAVPVVCAAVSDAASAQSRGYRYRDGRTYVYRTDRMGRSIDRGSRYRIYMPSYRYKEPAARSRTVYRNYGSRYGNDYRYGNYGYNDNYDYGYRDGYRYRDGYSTRPRHANLLNLVLLAAGSRYADRYYQRDRYNQRGRGRCSHRGSRHFSL